MTATLTAGANMTLPPSTGVVEDMLDYRLQAYAPDGEWVGELAFPQAWSASLVFNTLGAMQLKYSPGATGAELLEEPVEVAIEAYNQTTRRWVEVRNGRYRVVERRRDVAKHDTDMIDYTCVSYGSLMDGIVVIPGKYGNPTHYDKDGKRKFLSATPGQILTGILAEARATVTGLTPGLTLGFTPTTDSNGKPWNKKATLYFEPGLSLLTIVETLAERGLCDFWMQGRTLHVVNPDSTAKQTSIELMEDNAGEYPVRATIGGLLHTAFLVGEDGATWRVDNTGTPTPWGTSMKVLTQGGVRDETTARDMIGQELVRGSRERYEYTWSAQQVHLSWLAMIDVQLGDWLQVHTPAGFVPMRLFQTTLSMDQAGIKVALTLNDRFEDAQVRQDRKIKGIVSGASGDAGTTTLPSARDAAKAIPAKPQGLVAESEGYWDGDLPRSLVRVGFAPVALDVNGLGISIGHYEVNVAGKIVQATETTGIVVDDLAPNHEVAVQVVAVSRDGMRSEPAAANVVTVQPDDKLDLPTMLAGSVNMGIVTLSWDGKLQASGGAPYTPPAHFDHIRIEESADQSTWQGVDTTGTMSVLDRQDHVGQTLYYRAIAVDRLGHESDPSPVTAVQVVNALAEQIGAALQESRDAQAFAEQVGQEASSRLTEAEVKITTLRESELPAVQEAVSQARAEVDALETRATTSEGKISALEADSRTAHNELVEAQAALVDAQAAAAAGESMLPDPGFEYGGSAYAGVGNTAVARTQTKPYLGQWSAEFTATGKGNNVFGTYHYVDGVVPSHWYRIGCWVWIEAGLTHSLVSQNLVSEGGYQSTWTTTTTTGRWVRVENVFQAPAASVGKMRFWMGISLETNTVENTGKHLWVDELTMHDITDVKAAEQAVSKAQARADQAYQLANAATTTAEVQQMIQTSASGLNKITYSAANPSGSGKAVGDTWLKTSSSGSIIGQWQWNGSSWVARTVDNALIANLDAGKITSGTIDARRIAAGSITGGKIAADTLTSSHIAAGAVGASELLAEQATIDKLWAGGISALTVDAQKLVVTSANLIPGVAGWASGDKTGWEEFGLNTADAAIWLKGYTSQTSSARVTLEPGITYHCSVDVKATVADTIYYVALVPLDSTLPIGYLLFNKRVSKANVWEHASESVTVSRPYQARIMILANRGNEAANPGGYQWFRNLSLRPMVGTTLIEPGAVTTDRIAADAVTAEKLTVNQALINKLAVSSLWAGKITTQMLTAGDSYAGSVSVSQAGIKIKGSSSGSVTLTSAGLTAKASDGSTTVRIDQNGKASFKGSIVAGSTISAPVITGGTISGSTIIGGTVKTATTGRRLETTSYGIDFYDTDNTLTTTVDSDGLRFWTGGKKVGLMGENRLKNNHSVHGITFDLEYEDGRYMAFGHRQSADATFISMDLIVDPWGYANGDGMKTAPGITFNLPIYCGGDPANNYWQRLQFGLVTLNGMDHPALMGIGGRTGIAFGTNELYLIANNTYYSLTSILNR